MTVTRSRATGARAEERDAASQQLPSLEQGEPSKVLEIESLAKETKPPRRYSDALAARRDGDGGKLVDDEELREAMKDSGDRHGRPTRAANHLSG